MTAVAEAMEVAARRVRRLAHRCQRVATAATIPAPLCQAVLCVSVWAPIPQGSASASTL